MFLQNKYTAWYYRIIENAQNRHLTGYSEKHHVIPLSLGGLDDISNKIKLTAREHFIAHKLLVRMTTGKNKMKMSYAFCCFMRRNPLHKGRLDLSFSSRDYETRKKLMADATSKLHKGKKKNPLSVQKALETKRLNKKPYPESARKIHSENTRKRWKNDYEKMVQAHRTESFKKKISEANKGHDRLSVQQREKLYEGNRGTNNARARKIIITSPDGIIYHCHGSFQSFCAEHSLPFSSMCHILHKSRSFSKGATVGWDAVYDN